ncbi:MAG: glyceraldehyde 3-phosphate dehydrogenase NAD-binding domain-containing protein [Pseudomonadota bacterium]
MSKVRIGLMGFGRVGRQLYALALDDPRFEVVAISDVGQPWILHHLLTKSTGRDGEVRLEGNYLVSEHGRTRLMPADHPNEIPWDVFGVDTVVDATGRFRSARELTPHLHNGARRVVLSVLPEDDHIDRIVLYGVNEGDARAEDQVVSAGSASTTAAALTLKTLADAHAVEQASITSVHEYTSDQSLQDYAGPDYRRSRSGAKNVIPNTTPARPWVQRALPELDGRVTGYALNVPVQIGSMLDVTVAFRDPEVDPEVVNALFRAAAEARPALIQVVSDPIVSSDVKGLATSLLQDQMATMKAGRHMVKVIGWHETLGHARRILDVAGLYSDLDDARQQEAS